MIREIAPAKVNLVLRIGEPTPNRLHAVCSLFASLELHDVVEVRVAERDAVVCEGVDGPNLAEAAIRAFREEHPALPPLEVRIEKRIPVAAGLAGGSADAAAVLRAANKIAGEPFDADRLRAIGTPLGSDVPSQVEPAHAIVTGTGERVERVDLPEMALLLVTASVGLSTGDVFKKARRMRLPRARLECDDLRALTAEPVARMAERLENDLQAATLRLRPELEEALEALQRHGALGSLVSGSGPTVFGVFAGRPAAERAALQVPGSLVTMVAGR